MKQFDLIFISKIEEENKFFKYLQTANIVYNFFQKRFLFYFTTSKKFFLQKFY